MNGPVTLESEIRAGSASTLWIARTVLVALGVAAGTLVVGLSLAPAPELRWFWVCVGPWVAIYLWNLYAVGFRVAIALTLTRDGILAWRSPFWSGTLSVGAIGRVDELRWPRLGIRLRHTTGHLDCNPMMARLPALIAALAERRPDLVMSLRRTRATWGIARQLGVSGRAGSDSTRVE